MASADIINPQTFNRYVYVGNNPVNITDPTGLGWGELNGTVRWFPDDAARDAAGFGAYVAQVAWSQDGRTMFALNAVTGAAVQVQTAAEVFRQLATWGAGAGAIGATASALGLPIATGVALTAAYVAIMTSGSAPDAGGFDGPAIGRYTINNQLMMQNKADELAKQVNQSSTWKGGESSPADPNSVKPDPDDNKPTYEPNPKHGKQQQGNVSPEPTNGQAALDRAVPFRKTSPRKVGVDPATGEIVVFHPHRANQYHGHVRSWSSLSQQMRNALIKSGQTNRRGKVK